MPKYNFYIIVIVCYSFEFIALKLYWLKTFVKSEYWGKKTNNWLVSSVSWLSLIDSLIVFLPMFEWIWSIWIFFFQLKLLFILWVAIRSTESKFLIIEGVCLRSNEENFPRRWAPISRGNLLPSPPPPPPPPQLLPLDNECAVSSDVTLWRRCKFWSGKFALVSSYYIVKACCL